MAKYEYTMGKEFDMAAEEKKVLEKGYMKANLLLHAMYTMMDILYGKDITMQKLIIVEVLARYPYWAWENAAYSKLTKEYAKSSFPTNDETERQLHLIEVGRHSQDNEQWHLLIIKDLLRQRNIRQSWMHEVFLPRFFAFGYYYMTRWLYAVNPAWAFSLNARFESHAEYEYMRLAAKHPEWENEAVESEYFKFYPKPKTLRDLFRRIALDERDHMHESMEEYEKVTGRELV